MVWRLNYKFKMPAEKIRKLGERKALSPVITTVLLILVSVTAIVIISGVIIPFVRDSLSGSKECFEVIDQITINSEYGYACYYDRDAGYKTVNITISRKDIEISGLKIKIGAETDSVTFDIPSGNYVLVNKNSDKTYSLETDFLEVRYAEIYAVTKNNKLCDKSDSLELEAC